MWKRAVERTINGNDKLIVSLARSVMILQKTCDINNFKNSNIQICSIDFSKITKDQKSCFLDEQELGIHSLEARGSLRYVVYLV
jgi:hypothetical protein